MTKIGVLLSAGPGGGTLQYSQAIVDAALALPGHFELTAAIADPLWEGTLPARMSVVRLRDTTWTRVLNRVWHFSGLPVSFWRRALAPLDSNVRVLQRQNCDLWVCPNHDRYSFRAPIPALGTVHDLMHRYERRFAEVSAEGEYESREFHFSETCRWSRGVLVDSELGKKQLVESYGIAPDNVFVLPYVAPAYIYEDDGSNVNAVQERYSLPRKFFFYPAQFYRHKNHTTLLDALARMRDDHPDVKLVLVGATERNSYEEVMRRINDLGLSNNVVFLGYVPDADMAALYRLARALVMPTYFGPTNIPQLEAFALGCPVATSRIYGIPEQVGDAALLFDPSSADEIHDCLVRLWTEDDLCAELAQRGRQRSAEWGPQQFRNRFREIVETLT